MSVGYVLGKFTVPSAESVTATNGGGGPTAVSVTAGAYTIDSLCAHMESQLDVTRPGSGGATWSVSVSTTTGLVTIGMSAGTFSLTMSANLAALLGHATTITTQTSVTGAGYARGIWIPGCPLFATMDQRTNPKRSDLRQTESPTGLIYGLVGNYKYRHPGLRWSHVARNRVFDVDSAVPNWERFVEDVQIGSGHSWFAPCARVYVYDQTGNAIGSDQSVLSWQMKGVNGTDEVRRAAESWNGLWSVEIPELVSDGST